MITSSNNSPQNMYPTTLSLALLALSPLAASKPFAGHVPHPAPGPRDLFPKRAFARHVRHSPGSLRALRRRANAPTNLAEGSLSAAEGCTAWARPVSGDSCYSLIADVGIAIDAFKTLNEQIDAECHNLWAGYDYCVAKTTSSSSSEKAKASASASASSSVKAKASATVAKAVKVVKVASTITSAPTASATATQDEDEDDDDDEDGECEADDGEDDGEDDDDESISSAAASTTTLSPPSSKATSHSQSAAYSAAAKTTTTTTSAAARSTAAATTSSEKAASSSAKTLLAAAGVDSFLGTNTGIGSWYDADSSRDSTNGRSWCEFEYNDDSPIFAPSVGTMRANFDGDNAAAAAAYCGLEAIVTTPDGASMTMVIGDGFDDAWVLSPGSIDIMHDAFNTLYGSSTDDKDTVIKNIQWTLTGNRNDKYKYQGTGDA